MNQNIKLSNGKLVEKPQNKNSLYILTFIMVVIIAGIVTNFSISTLIANFPNFTTVIIKMLPPLNNPQQLKEYFSYSSQIWPELVLTLQMAIAGTLIGVILAFPVAVIASVNISSKTMSVITKFLLSLTRTLPVLIYAMIFSYLFGLGEFAGLVAIAVFTFGIVTKMLYEIIERIDMGAYEAAISSGTTSYNAFNLTIMPEIMPSFYSISLYSFEINIRSAAILGYVGAGGIGQQLKDAMSLAQYDKAGLIIIYTFLLVLIIDLLTQFIRKVMI